jgi:hypothetical protein
MEIERPKAAPPKAAIGGYPSSQTATTVAADRFEALPLELRLLALGLPMPESLAVAAWGWSTDERVSLRLNSVEPQPGGQEMSDERQEVAEWAQYCQGSYYGDQSPQTKAIYDRVMREDAVFEFYRQTLADYKAHKNADRDDSETDIEKKAKVEASRLLDECLARYRRR